MLTKLDEEKFDIVYALLEESFPPDERRTYEGQKALLKDARYTVFTYEEDGKILAAMLTWNLDSALFLEHFAVFSKYRGMGLGARLLALLSEKAGRRICLEVEPPDTEIARRRIAFYERSGFSRNLFPYLQPSLSEGKNPVPLQIMTTGGALDEESFANIKKELYEKVYHYKERVSL